MKTKIYVFSYTSTETLGIEDVRTFSTEEKAHEEMKKWKESTLEEGDMLSDLSDDLCQIITASGVTWTAEITETVLDEDDTKLFIAYSDSMIVDVDGEERSFCGWFRDGHALLKDDETGENVPMFYPYADNLTPEMVAEIEEYTGRPLKEYYQIAVKYGKIQQPKNMKS